MQSQAERERERHRSAEREEPLIPGSGRSVSPPSRCSGGAREVIKERNRSFPRLSLLELDGETKRESERPPPIQGRTLTRIRTRTWSFRSDLDSVLPLLPPAAQEGGGIHPCGGKQVAGGALKPPRGGSATPDLPM